MLSSGSDFSVTLDDNGTTSLPPLLSSPSASSNPPRPRHLLYIKATGLGTHGWTQYKYSHSFFLDSIVQVYVALTFLFKDTSLVIFLFFSFFHSYKSSSRLYVHRYVTIFARSTSLCGSFLYERYEPSFLISFYFFPFFFFFFIIYSSLHPSFFFIVLIIPQNKSHVIIFWRWFQLHWYLPFFFTLFFFCTLVLLY